MMDNLKNTMYILHTFWGFKNKEEDVDDLYNFPYLDVYYTKEEAMKDIKDMGEYIKSELKHKKQSISRSNIEDKINYTFRLIITKKSSRNTDMGYKNIIKYIAELGIKYNKECYDKLLDIIDYEEQYYDINGELIEATIHLGSNYFYLSEKNFDPNYKYKFKPGDVVRNTEYSCKNKGVFIVTHIPRSIFEYDESINPIEYMTNKYEVIGITEKGYFSASNVSEYYLELVNDTIKKDSFLDIIRDMALEKRPFYTEEEYSTIYQNNNKDFIEKGYKTLDSFK